MNPATDELLDQLRGGVRPVKNRNRSVEEEAAQKLSRGPDGRIGTSGVHLYAAMVAAGRKVKNGKTQISTATTTTLPGLISIDDMYLPFEGDPQWVADKRRGVNPKGGEMVCIVRPRFDEWSFKVGIIVDEDEIDPNTVREVLRIAGRFIGLGDFRPSKRGPFGCFRIAEWNLLGKVTDD